ncbi:MAG: hypothetical protein AB7K24_18410 [Gemmataceae bacterium]
MPKKLSAALIVMLATWAVAWAADPAVERVVNEAVRELGAEDFRSREAATSALLKLGLDAIPLLEAKRDQSEDAEVRRRIDGVIAAIQRARAALEFSVDPVKDPIKLDPDGAINLTVRIKNVSARPQVLCRLDGPVQQRFIYQTTSFALVARPNGMAECVEIKGPKVDNGATAALLMDIRDSAGKPLVPHGIIGASVDKLGEADFLRVEPGKETSAVVKVPLKVLGLTKPGNYELSINYRVQGDGAPNGISVEGKSKKQLDLLLSTYRCNLAVKLKLLVVEK